MQNNIKRSPLTYLLSLLLFLILLTVTGFSLNEEKPYSYSHDPLARTASISFATPPQTINAATVQTTSSSSSPFILHFIWLGTALGLCGIISLAIRFYQPTQKNFAQSPKHQAFTTIVDSKPFKLNFDIH